MLQQQPQVLPQAPLLPPPSPEEMQSQPRIELMRHQRLWDLKKFLSVKCAPVTLPLLAFERWHSICLMHCGCGGGSSASAGSDPLIPSSVAMPSPEQQQEKMAAYREGLRGMSPLQLLEQMDIINKRLQEQLSLSAAGHQRIQAGEGTTLERAADVAVTQAADNRVSFLRLQLLQIQTATDEAQPPARADAPPADAQPAAATGAGAAASSSQQAPPAGDEGGSWQRMADEHDEQPRRGARAAPGEGGRDARRRR